MGEPGAGKSRLVDELLERGDGFRALEIACDEYDASTPYLAVGRALRTLLGLAEDDTPEAAAARLSTAVEEHAPELAPWLPLLATLILMKVKAKTDLWDEFQALLVRYREVARANTTGRHESKNDRR